MFDRYMNRYYYTFSELFQKITDVWQEPNAFYMLGKKDYKINNDRAIAVASEQVLALSFTDNKLNNDIANNLIFEHLLPRLYNSYVLSTNKENIEITSEEFIEWYTSFLNLISRTFDKYKTILEYYESKKSELLNQVLLESESRFNDTPQNLPTEGGFQDDNYSSSITKSKTGNDFATPMQRLDEINRLYKDIMQEWCEYLENCLVYRSVN